MLGYISCYYGDRIGQRSWWRGEEEWHECQVWFDFGMDWGPQCATQVCIVTSHEHTFLSTFTKRARHCFDGQNIEQEWTILISWNGKCSASSEYPIGYGSEISRTLSTEQRARTLDNLMSYLVWGLRATGMFNHGPMGSNRLLFREHNQEYSDPFHLRRI